ncbi:MAG: TIR domain-containing protein, partial [Chloroflexota bacterium]
MSLNVIKLIEELITQAQKMEYEESGKELDAILRTAKLRIRKIFGDESTHLKDISSIRFSPVAYSSSNRDRAFQKQFRKGKYQLINLFYTLIEDIELSDQLSQTEEDNNLTVDIFSDKIFVVHGHDNEMKQSTARILEKIGLEPIILHEQANEGKTIIEKFLANAGQVSFAVVLLSPDDVGRSVNSD